MKPHQQQLIGQQAEITASPNEQLVGIKGIIEDETKNTLTINGKQLPKNEITITINNQAINGNTINKSITERIKVQKQ